MFKTRHAVISEEVECALFALSALSLSTDASKRPHINQSDDSDSDTDGSKRQHLDGSNDSDTDREDNTEISYLENYNFKRDVEERILKGWAHFYMLPSEGVWRVEFRHYIPGTDPTAALEPGRLLGENEPQRGLRVPYTDNADAENLSLFKRVLTDRNFAYNNKGRYYYQNEYKNLEDWWILAINERKRKIETLFLKDVANHTFTGFRITTNDAGVVDTIRVTSGYMADRHEFHCVLIGKLYNFAYEGRDPNTLEDVYRNTQPFNEYLPEALQYAIQVRTEGIKKDREHHETIRKLKQDLEERAKQNRMNEMQWVLQNFKQENDNKKKRTELFNTMAKEGGIAALSYEDQKWYDESFSEDIAVAFFKYMKKIHKEELADIVEGLPMWIDGLRKELKDDAWPMMRVVVSIMRCVKHMANMVVDYYTNTLKEDPVTYATKITARYVVTLELPDLGAVSIRVGTRASNALTAQKRTDADYSKYAAISWSVVFSKDEDDAIALAAKEGIREFYPSQDDREPVIISLSMLNCALNGIWTHPTAMSPEEKEESYRWTVVPLPVEELQRIVPQLKKPKPKRPPLNPAPAPPPFSGADRSPWRQKAKPLYPP